MILWDKKVIPVSLFSYSLSGCMKSVLMCDCFYSAHPRSTQLLAFEGQSYTCFVNCCINDPGGLYLED